MTYCLINEKYAEIFNFEKNYDALSMNKSLNFQCILEKNSNVNIYFTAQEVK